MIGKSCSNINIIGIFPLNSTPFIPYSDLDDTTGSFIIDGDLSTNYLSTNNECYIGGSLASPYPTVY